MFLPNGLEKSTFFNIFGKQEASHSDQEDSLTSAHLSAVPLNDLFLFFLRLRAKVSCRIDW